MTNQLTSARVHEIVIDCLYREAELNGATTREELPKDAIIVEGIVNTTVFHPGRIAGYKLEIGDLLAELPDQFQRNGGGGWSFLNACTDRHDHQWGEHRDMESLFCLGIATNQVEWIMKDFCSVLPGGVPYVVVGEKTNLTTS